MTLTLQRRRQKDPKFESSLGYETMCQKIKIEIEITEEAEEEEQLSVGGQNPWGLAGCLSSADTLGSFMSSTLPLLSLQ